MNKIKNMDDLHIFDFDMVPIGTTYDGKEIFTLRFKYDGVTYCTDIKSNADRKKYSTIIIQRASDDTVWTRRAPLISSKPLLVIVVKYFDLRIHNTPDYIHCVGIEETDFYVHRGMIV